MSTITESLLFENEASKGNRYSETNLKFDSHSIGHLNSKIKLSTNIASIFNPITLVFRVLMRLHRDVFGLREGGEKNEEGHSVCVCPHDIAGVLQI